MFSETLASDIEFVQLFLEKADIKYKRISVEHVELSHTEADLGESDITVKVKVDDTGYGLLIEDKIDAIAMDQQYER